MAATAINEQSVTPGPALNIRGTSLRVWLALPARFACSVLLWLLIFPPLLVLAALRALYLRLKVGKPSQILRKGGYNMVHMRTGNIHYPATMLFREPLDETKLRTTLIWLCGEGGIEETDVHLEFHAEQPNDWPQTGSWDADHFIGRNILDYAGDWKKRGDPLAKIKMHVWNGLPGKPTLVYYYGSFQGWDGTSNFNFVKELMHRYMGNKANNVYVEPDMDPKSAAILDQASFVAFMLKLPFAIAKNVFMHIWWLLFAAKWAGGPGMGNHMAIMNFTPDESKRFYAGCKQQGVTPFAAFTFAAVKGCTEVVGERPLSILQQASLQSRHYPVDKQDHRDFVGDWLAGPVQKVPKTYGLKEAMRGYDDLKSEVDVLGPDVRESLMAKAYGLINSGSGLFQFIPTYNMMNHVFDRQILMNNYGIRTMPPGSPVVSWNWCGPFWLLVNTMNLEGATTTSICSCFFGREAVELIRDNMEDTLRKMMTDSSASDGDSSVLPSSFPRRL